MTMPLTNKQKEILKAAIRNAFLELPKEEQGGLRTFADMAYFVNRDQKRFQKVFKGAISGASIKDFRNESLVEEKKAQAKPSAPNFDRAIARAKKLKSLPDKVCFVWPDQFPPLGLYVVTRDGSVYLALDHSSSPEKRPEGLAEDSLVYLLTQDSGIALDQAFAYRDIGFYQTRQEAEAQQKKDDAAALDDQRWNAYGAGTGIYRDQRTTMLWYRGNPITYLGADVRIAGDGRVYAGETPADQLFEGRYEYDAELRIPVADVYTRVVAQAGFQVVGPARGPFHRQDHASYSRATVPITDFPYYADVLYQRLLASGFRVKNEALYYDLPGWVGGGLRHLTVVFQGNSAAAVLGAIRAALEADESPGARLSDVADGRWHVTIARNWTSTENTNFYPDGDIVYQDQQRGPAYYASIGSPEADEVIGSYGDLLTEDSLNTRMRW